MWQTHCGTPVCRQRVRMERYQLAILYTGAEKNLYKALHLTFRPNSRFALKSNRRMTTSRTKRCTRSRGTERFDIGKSFPAAR